MRGIVVVVRIVTCVVMIVLVAAGCTSSADGPPALATRSSKVMVTMDPSTIRVVAGGSGTATIRVVNNSGRSVPKRGCDLFNVALTTSRSSPDHPIGGIGWHLCLRDLAIPVGTTEHVIEFSAAHGSCTRRSHGRPREVLCLPSGAPPLLPGGTYWLWLYQDPQDLVKVPTPEPVSIEVYQQP